MKMGANILRQDMNVFYSGNNGRSGYMDFNGRFTAANAISPAGKQVGEADFVLGLPDELRTRSAERNLGPARHHLGLLLPGRLACHQQSDTEPRAALGISHAARSKLKIARRTSACSAASWNLPARTATSRALYAPYKKDFQPRTRFCLHPGHPQQENGGSRRVYHLLVHGRHRHQPPPPVESASRRRDHHALQHAGRHLSRDDAGPGALRLEQPGPLSQRHHSPVGSQPQARRSATVEPHHGVPVARPATHSVSATSDSMAPT